MTERKKRGAVDPPLAKTPAEGLEDVARHFEKRLIPGVMYTREHIVGAIREYGRARPTPAREGLDDVAARIHPMVCKQPPDTPHVSPPEFWFCREVARAALATTPDPATDEEWEQHHGRFPFDAAKTPEPTTASEFEGDPLVELLPSARPTPAREGLSRDAIVKLFDKFCDIGDYGSGSSDAEGFADALLAKTPDPATGLDHEAGCDGDDCDPKGRAGFAGWEPCRCKCHTEPFRPDYTMADVATPATGLDVAALVQRIREIVPQGFSRATGGKIAAAIADALARDESR